MKQFFSNLGVKIRDWLRTRYGTDKFSRFLDIAGLIIMLIGMFFKQGPGAIIYIIGWVTFLYGAYRSLSHYSKAGVRQSEQEWYFKRVAAVKGMWKMLKGSIKDKDHCYYMCKKCKTVMRAPKGKGTIILTCPNCHNRQKAKS